MPRRIAYDVLCQVLGKKRPLDEAFNSHPHLEKLSPKAKAFSRAVVTSAIRNKGFIDHLIDACLDKRPKGQARNVLNIMRLGVAQLYFMNVPAHAAVNESLNLTNYAKLIQYKKLINAVLRRIEREKKEYPAAEIAKHNIPVWLMESWVNAYGEETAQKIAEAHLKEAPLDITPKYDDEADIWAKRLGAEKLANGSLRLAAGGRIEELDGYSNGSWWVQDAAAAEPAKLLGDVKGKTVLDLCAAPGGKTMQLAAAGAKVIALDKNENRLKRVTENLERTKLKAEIVAADLMDWQPDGEVDAILLDAPCTATGTLRRHPDGLWTKRAEDIKAVADIQGTLWHRASGWVKPGGVIVYCTCSLQPEEGELMLKAFLKGHKNFEMVGDAPLRFLPHEGKDGFFAVAVKRVS
ncbi:transcription antitermination factor NusB [Terasakiella sp. A23]|uniref:RsmB/NOP family class I SAM-dependent RNA methyltransferase n=1 Tax=Terasakiella sp. FCG-A23 TaxID=3080561 RepID=UPI002954309C|nr:transcription antitermination factor NusB [Terasakiella sp. A23]MDV7340853.1 transcription antitermination factor NusB [Terasakiella sp. A23]